MNYGLQQREETSSADEESSLCSARSEDAPVMEVCHATLAGLLVSGLVLTPKMLSRLASLRNSKITSPYVFTLDNLIDYFVFFDNFFTTVRIRMIRFFIFQYVSGFS